MSQSRPYWWIRKSCGRYAVSLVRGVREGTTVFRDTLGGAMDYAIMQSSQTPLRLSEQCRAGMHTGEVREGERLARGERAGGEEGKD